jgi:steroid delta-isomerase-like uncharacterized protein
MGIEENKDIVRRLVDDGWNPNSQATFDAWMAEDLVNHDPVAPQVRSREELEAFHTSRVTAFPDQHTTIDDLIGEGDQVVKRWTWRGTHQGDFQGIPPTGKQVTIQGVSVYRINNGKIAEVWWGYDSLGVLQQLGVIPQTEQAPA